MVRYSILLKTVFQILLNGLIDNFVIKRGLSKHKFFINRVSPDETENNLNHFCYNRIHVEEFHTDDENQVVKNIRHNYNGYKFRKENCILSGLILKGPVFLEIINGKSTKGKGDRICNKEIERSKTNDERIQPKIDACADPPGNSIFA